MDQGGRASTAPMEPSSLCRLAEHPVLAVGRHWTPALLNTQPLSLKSTFHASCFVLGQPKIGCLFVNRPSSFTVPRYVMGSDSKAKEEAQGMEAARLDGAWAKMEAWWDRIHIPVPYIPKIYTLLKWSFLIIIAVCASSIDTSERMHGFYRRSICLLEMLFVIFPFS